MKVITTQVKLTDLFNYKEKKKKREIAISKEE
jgi:hypothetical protein